MTDTTPTTELGLPDDRIAIVMKSGVPIWVSNELGMKVRATLATQEGHGFLVLKELGGRSINTSSIDDVCDVAQYEDYTRVKQGEWQCAWKKWHPKKGECQCQSEARAKQRESEKKAQDAKDNKPMTDEERARQAEAFRKSNEMYALDNPQSMFRGAFVAGSRSGKQLRRSTILEWQDRNPDREPPIEGLAIDEDIL